MASVTTSGVTTMGDRERRVRAKNRALLVVLLGLVALFYALAIVRMGG
jgi:hypothetical protein